MVHKFAAGQMVRFSRGYPHRNAADGFYQVIQQLPYGDSDYQYRIKSEQHERVVKEGELEKGLSSAKLFCARPSRITQIEQIAMR